MDHSVHNKLVSFIWSIADDCLRDVYVRGKYRDVILPMFVLRRWIPYLSQAKKRYWKKYAFKKKNWHSPNWMNFPLKKNYRSCFL